MTQSEALLQIAVVEDNDTLRDLLVSYLTGPERHVTGVDCGEALSALLATQRLDIVILDLNLPHEDGLSIAQRLRHSHPQIHIVMLTARVRPSDRTAGYSAGADVYLTKPTNVAELDAVVSNLASRRRPTTSDGFTFNRAARILTSPQLRQVVLTWAEATILEALVLGAREGVDSETLLDRLGRNGNPQLGRDNLAVIISRMRSKIEAELDHVRVVVAVRQMGYRLNVPIALI